MMLLLTILLCSLVAGLLFGFAVVVMPGIANLENREFLMAFKHMDEVIQNNQPLFIMVWGGSILSVFITLILGTMNTAGMELYLLWFASALYLLGVQIPTFRFNIPLNNSLQSIEIQSLDESAVALFRTSFETPWNGWNRLRTINAVHLSRCCLYFSAYSNFHPKPIEGWKLITRWNQMGYGNTK